VLLLLMVLSVNTRTGKMNLAIMPFFFNIYIYIKTTRVRYQNQHTQAYENVPYLLEYKVRFFLKFVYEAPNWTTSQIALNCQIF